jgi:glycosyltransferase involved in cell wall biosynthesis
MISTIELLPTYLLMTGKPTRITEPCNWSWFLLPSEHENFGIAAMEAVKYGCAIAISDQVYLADEMPEGSEILPVRIDAWSKFMRERMQDDIWQKQQARKVAEVLLRKFDHNEVAQNWIDTIEATIRC